MAALGQNSYTRTNGAQVIDTVFPRFHMAEVQDQLATEREGRPIYKLEERVEILMPGNPHTKPVFKVTDEHRERWPEHYERFKKGLEMALDGTPIEQWSILNRAQVLELKALEIHTIEACANLTDTAIQRIPMYGRRLRDLAKAYLDDAEHMKQVTQLQAAADRMESRLAEQDKQIAELRSMNETMYAQLQAFQNAPNPLLSTPAFHSDPVEMAKVQNASLQNEPAAESSLANLAVKRRPGRPRKSESEQQPAA